MADYYNWERPHSAHNGKTPMERYFELAEKTPYSDAVHANYQPNEEHIQEQNYKLELELRKLKRCLGITQLIYILIFLLTCGLTWL